MSSGGHNPFPIIGVGASAGGLGALKELLSALPAQPGLALVVIQHLDPHHQSHLVDLLRPHTGMTVLEVDHGTRVEPDRVYVIKPNTDVAIADGVLSVTARPDARRPHYPVDHFLRSLASVQGAHAVGVVLSGTGSDGTLGLCEIKAAGGVTFAQSEQSAEHPGMPQSAISAGAVDLALTPAQIAARLTELARHPFLHTAGAADQRITEDAEQFRRVIRALRKNTGVDFSQYRDTTIKRRTARRMLVRGQPSLAHYAEVLEQDRDEAEALYRDVLIHVTSFFRDAELFEDLKREVYPRILKEKRSGEPLRVWVPGCSTGQEAYSIAMTLVEFLESQDAAHPVQIFATDLGDPDSLDKARAGLYPESIEAEVSPERLRRFFAREDHGYRVSKSLRERCVFARQNLTVDPPFSRVDLVSCRNVLIYMSPALQQRLLPVFHFALNPHGFLVLGLAESIGQFGDLFEVVSRKHKIYRRRSTGHRPQVTFLAGPWTATTAGRRPASVLALPNDFVHEADRLLLGEYSPPSVLVDQNLDVQQFRGRTALFLEPPTGQPTTNLLRMAKEGLQAELRSALAEARASRAQVVRDKLHVVDAGQKVEFTLRILPITPPQTSDLYLLVLFETSAIPGAPRVMMRAAADSGTATEHDVARLRQELESNREYLQAIIDTHESADQELRAAHEELLSSNEELQSTNEELETTKEELQSANEELATVNEQLQTRNRELDAANEDLSNFISSADIALITVGRDLAIRRLTPAAAKPFNLVPTDVGRSIEHIKFALKIDSLGEAIRQVITSARQWEREVLDRDGHWWLVQVKPHITTEGGIDGATVIAVPIDVIKQAQALIEARDYALAVLATVREPLIVLDAQLRIGLANQAYYDLFGGTKEDTEGRQLYETAGEAWADPDLRQALQTASSTANPIVDMEIERTLPGRGARLLRINARSIVREGHPLLLLLGIQDITEHREADALRIETETLRRVNRRKDEFLGILAHELRNPLAPMRFALEVLRRAERDPVESGKARQVLERQVAHMVRIVDDLLDVSRITQGKVELRKETIDLRNLVHAAVELSRPLLTAAGHEITLSMPSEPVRLNADPVRLTQVLINLLNNGAKFTPPGGHIWLIGEISEDPGDVAPSFRIRVRDTGVGIAPEALPHIFDMFMQGDRSLEKTRGGLGVGLTLVRDLVALHGGTVQARSEGPGAGSEFIVTLPMDPALQAEPVASVSEDGETAAHPLRILVADDNEDGREMLALFLQQKGHQVATAADGPKALAAVADFRPDVAVLDVGMPGLNGYDVAARLRERYGDGSLVLVALSGLGQEADKARAAQSGFDRHFTKPVDVNVLAGFLATVPGRAN
jgi:two-component system, chemotaxis family, CheB/CheR fusion protein